jgi:hypothetical protein
MGDYECHQTGYIPANGLVPMPCQDLLRQVSTACGSGPNTRIDLRPQGMFCDICRLLILMLTAY